MNTEHRGALRRIALLTTVLTLALAGWGASSASAGTITVWGCHQSNGELAPLDGWDWHVSATGIYPWNFCNRDAPAQYFGMGVYQEFHPNGAYGSWTFTAPPGTTVSRLWYYRGVGITGSTDYGTFRGPNAVWDSHILESCQPGGCSQLTTGETSFSSLSERALLLYLRACTQPAGCNEFSSGWLAVSTVSVTLEDQQAPTFSGLTGSLIQPGPLHGDASLNMQLADVGTGVYMLHATVDGRSFDDRILDANGGKCRAVSRARDFVYVVPCRLSLTAATALNTATLPDGSHDVVVSVEDAAGNLTTVFHGVVTTSNGPFNVAAPELSGATRVGLPVSATPGFWTPPPNGLAYRWLRCPASGDVGSCTPIAGATASTYVISPADAYGRLRVSVTASNANGATTAVSAPSDVIADVQGRTSPPSADGGGNGGGVVVVPSVPGGSYSITTNISAIDASRLISGLINPLAGLAGHVANGTNANDLAQIRIAFRTRTGGRVRQVTTVRSTRNRRWTITGRLTDTRGMPIGGAQMASAWQLPGQRWIARTAVRTRPNGTFTYVLPPGPSRIVKFAYFAFSDSKGYAESNAITEKVTTPVTLRATPRVLRNGRAVRFSGTVGPDAMPKIGVLVTLEARAPGSSWTKFNVIRTRGRRFTARYRFHSTTRRTRYQFRATVAKQTGYPYEGGRSRRVGVVVTP